jgi:O-antigen ligase
VGGVLGPTPAVLQSAVEVAMRIKVVAVAYALWLLATEFLFYFYYSAGGGDDITVLKIAVLFGVVPAAMQLLLLGINPYGMVTPVRVALCFLLIALVSYLGNAYWTSLMWLASLAFVFAVTILVASSRDERLIRSIAVFYSIPAAFFLLYVSVTGAYVWGRLEAHGITADWWGLMGASLAMAGLSHRSRLLAALCIGVGLYITYVASARSDMLAILVGLLAVGMLELRALRGSRLVMAIAMSLAALVFFMLFSSTITDTVTEAVVSTMKLNDPSRGLGTGLTGRTTVWADVFQIWLRSPWFGVGFHQEMMLTSGAPAHMIYLAMLASTGIFGFIWYISFLGAALLAAVAIIERQTRNVVVGTIVAYVAIGFFDSHGLGSANPLGLYTEMCCFFALRHASLQRALRGMSGAIRLQPDSS